MANVDDELKNYLSKNREIREIKVPQHALRGAKNLMGAQRSVACPHCGKAITPFKKPVSAQALWNGLWLLGMVVSFSLSFVFPRFFLQFLAAALLFGVKWIVDQKATRPQILIYKALLKEDDELISRRAAQLKGL